MKMNAWSLFVFLLMSSVGVSSGLNQSSDARPETSMTASQSAKAPLVDINRAGLEELQSLPRIGEKVAARIVEFRKANGPFERIEELMNVRGVGEKTFMGLKSRITVSGKKGSSGSSRSNS